MLDVMGGKRKVKRGVMVGWVMVYKMRWVMSEF